LDALFEARKTKGKPTLIIANTVKAKGVSFLENKWNSHATHISLEDTKLALKELGFTNEEIETAFS